MLWWGRSSCTPLIVGLCLALCLTPRALAQTASTPVPEAVTPTGPTTAATPGEAFLTSWVTWASLILTAASVWFLWYARALRPNILARGLRDLAPIETPFWFIAAITSYAAMALGGLPALLFLGDADPKSTRALATANLSTFTIALAVSVFLAVLLRRAAPDAGFKAPAKRWLLGLACLPLALPLVYLTSTLGQLVYELSTSTPITDPLAHPALRTIVNEPNDPWAWVMIFVAVVLAPIHEELVYRGFVQSGIVRITRHPWAAILLTSTLFALAHLSAQVPLYAIGSLFAFGVCLGFAFERSRSIAVPIAMHMAFNALNVVLAVIIS